jgi:hypothetical protein
MAQLDMSEIEERRPIGRTCVDHFEHAFLSPEFEYLTGIVGCAVAKSG